MSALAQRLSLVVVLLASGCTASSPYSEQELQVRCEGNGGRWHAALGREGYCEFQMPGMI